MQDYGDCYRWALIKRFGLLRLVLCLLDKPKSPCGNSHLEHDDLQFQSLLLSIGSLVFLGEPAFESNFDRSPVFGQVRVEEGVNRATLNVY